ncbi:MAG: cyclophilin-like fold protein [Candidatus Omnitrophota bacterium]
MEKKVRIKAGKMEALAQLNESVIAGFIWNALPICASANTWGDEVYFAIPVEADLADPRETVNLGDLGYWSEGRCFCIFFGPTPVSAKGEIRPASSVEVIGALLTDPQEFKQVHSGEKIVLEKVKNNTTQNNSPDRNQPANLK